MIKRFMDRSDEWKNLIPPREFCLVAVLILSIFAGVAFQNILMTILIIWLLFRGHRKAKVSRYSFKKAFLPSLALLFMHLWIGLSTILNPESLATSDVIPYWFGYAPIIFFPALVAGRFKGQTIELTKFSHFTVGLTFLWAIVVLSQSLWGWSLQAPSGGIDFRPKGFYSHPLTLAYVALLIWPVALNQLLRHVRQPTAWIFAGSVAWVIYASQSRTCQAIAALLLVWNIFFQLKGKVRWMILTVLTLGFILISVTPNPISHRFHAIFQEDNPDRFSDYPDDRLAFWHAHGLMIQERPWLGHGIRLNEGYRAPYYEKLGLSDFRRKYEAHNQFIQITAEGGIIAILLFISWGIGIVFLSRRVQDPMRRRIYLQTFVVFLISGLTQNAYMDAEVRHALTLMLALFALDATYLWTNQTRSYPAGNA